MSDYIEKQDVIDIIHKEIESTKSYIEHNTQINIKFAVEELPTLDEKEVIRKSFERVVERLEEYWKSHKALEDYEMFDGTYIEMKQQELVAKAYEKAIKIVKEECGISE